MPEKPVSLGGGLWQIPIFEETLPPRDGAYQRVLRTKERVRIDVHQVELLEGDSPFTRGNLESHNQIAISVRALAQCLIVRTK